MKTVALLIASTLMLGACSSGDDTFTVLIQVDPIYAKDGTIIDPRATVMAPAGM
ncbi:hypothetical protein [Roseivivax sp. CAU 1753]